ncbi:MAG: hypothetical protein KGZ30_03730 [Anaplasmataceae bacterium]|nr:hypothetical protein [Anaplasmataceae bacterium]
MSLFDYSSLEKFKEENGYTIDDVWYPRVTKIVGIKAKPALLFFYGEAQSYKHAHDISQKSAEEGTRVHEVSQAILLGQEPKVDEDIKPAIDAFRNFMEQKRIETAPEYIERRIVNYDHRYAGTIDAMALIDGKFGVMDIKTSQSIYRDYNLQTSAYMDSLKNEFPNLQTRWILRIDQAQVCNVCGATRRTKGGREKVRKDWKNGLKPCQEHSWGPVRGEIELKESPFWQGDFQAFLGAKKLWEWENEYWLKKVGYL